MVPHYKLRHYGIRWNTLKWIWSLLSQCHHLVILDGGKSSSIVAVVSGMLQGIVIGPLMLLVYINGLPCGLTTTVWLFTDECILHRAVANAHDCQPVPGLTRWYVLTCKGEQVVANAFSCEEVLHNVEESQQRTAHVQLHHEPICSQVSQKLPISGYNNCSQPGLVHKTACWYQCRSHH